MNKALASVRWGSRYAFIAAMVVAFLLLGWPFMDGTRSSPEEIQRTVIETIEVPVQVTRWFFFSSTEFQKQQVERTISETVVHQRTVSEFSWLLSLALILVGLLGRLVHRRLVRLLWILRG